MTSTPAPRTFAWFDGSGDYAAAITPAADGIALALSYVTGGEAWQYVGHRAPDMDSHAAHHYYDSTRSAWQCARCDAATDSCTGENISDYELAPGFAMCEDAPAQAAAIVWLDGAAYLLDDVTDY